MKDEEESGHGAWEGAVEQEKVAFQALGTSKGTQVRNSTGDLEKVRKDEEKTKTGLDMPPQTKRTQCHQ